MKKINIMRLVFCFAASVFLLNSSFAESKTFKIGEVYKYLYKNESIKIVSVTRVELAENGVIIRGKYSFKNGKLHIVTTSVGTKMEQYYQITKDGLLDKDGQTLYSKKGFAKVAGTALIGQIREKNWSRIETLLNSGADPNTKDNYGEPVLMNTHDHAMVKLLIESGANVNAKDKGGWTALIYAAKNGHTDIAKLLIEKGANVNAKNKDGDTALTSSVPRGHMNIVQLLIEKGVDVNAKNKDGDTALTYAVTFRNMAIAKLLLKHDADVNAKNKYGETALKLAKDGDYKEIVPILKNAGAKE